ncbi:dCTP deaminase domain-containing protein [Alistipes finegoldii]|jgi:deoxycytidine triphosphate deaminase|uniref:dCTP deaminase domain-containing protein n=1 Tax=Alistipes finegoldii TaxID=214856 RepID=UPI0018980B06|nr:hypothetical protein [Alistipes finegoldii]
MPPKRKIGVLTRSEIIAENVVTSDTIDEKSIKSASYDLRLGNEYYLPSDNNASTSIKFGIRKCSDSNDVLCLKPFSSIVFSTEEILSLPGNIVGRFDMRIAFAMQGLVLQVGPQVEPNYKGRLFGLLLNFSDKEVHIPRYARLLSIEFNYLFCNVIETGGRKNHCSLLEFLEGKPYVKGTLEAFLTRINRTYNDTVEIHGEMERTLRELELKRDKIRSFNITLILSVIAILLTLLIPFLTVYITKQTIDKDDYPFERIINLEREKDSLKSVNGKLKEDLLYIDHKIDSLNKNYEDQLQKFSEKEMKKNEK